MSSSDRGPTDCAQAVDGDSDVALRVADVCKVYHAWERPSDRLKQALFRWRRRWDREFWALRHVSVDVRRGEAFGIVGRNGSGKSTLLQIIAGALAPTSGEVLVSGRLATLLALGTGFDPELTGRENVRLNAAAAGIGAGEQEDRMAEIREFAEIGDFIDQPVRTYSSGMYSRLAFALAITARPDVLLVDEALAVGDEGFQRKCFARLDELRAEGTTLLLVSHAASTIVEFCDRALLLDRGERLLVGAPKTVVSNYQRLIYAPAERAAELRDEIQALDRGEAPDGTSLEAQSALGPVARAEPSRLERAHYEPELRPSSTVSYEPHGAEISDVCIRTPGGDLVNVLERGEAYLYEFCVDFAADAYGVRFGMLFKNVTGSELGGLSSHPFGKGLPSVEAGRRLRVRIPFRARLLPGTYFANAGVMGVDGGERFLHRILDATMFRVALESDLNMTEMVDFSSEGETTVEAVDADWVGASGAERRQGVE